MRPRNGRLDPSTLTGVDGWARLEDRCAAAWTAGCDKMQRLGFARPSITAPDGAYRTFEQQQYWKKYWTARGHPGNAATPGYSNHGMGTAVDIWNVSKWPQVTLRSVFREFGFIFDVPSEAWHMRHDGRSIPAYTSTAGSSPFSTIPTPPEDDMFNDTDRAALASARDEARAAKETAERALRSAAVAAEDAAEVRRMLGMLLGYTAPANATENTGKDALRAAAEARRMLGVIFGYNQPANEQEAQALARLHAQGTATGEVLQTLTLELTGRAIPAP